MIYNFQGNYLFDQKTVSGWNSSAIGIYYCGYQNQKRELVPFYIGRAVSNDGIRGRLLQHLSENKWLDVSVFGYTQCTTPQEALNLEEQEIVKFQPKYNTQGK
jgi:excinuclease UvrABC nuclease subunit